MSKCRQSSEVRDEDYMEAMELILCKNHDRPSHQRKPDLILSHLYVGNVGNAENYNLLRDYGITHVLNCAGYKGVRSYQGSPYQGLDIEYKELPADDSESYDMSQHFRECIQFLDRVKRKGGCALVHCAQGINRSIAVCIAYTMVDKNYSLLKAVKHIQNKRGCVLSNRGFQRQLVKFAREFGSLDSPNELDKILPKEPEDEPIKTQAPIYVKNGKPPVDDFSFNSYVHTSYPDSTPFGTLEKSIQIIERDDSQLNGATVATGSSIFEDYLRRMRSK